MSYNICNFLSVPTKPRQLEALKFGLRKWITLSIHYLFSETKALNNGGVTAKLICVFVFHIQKQCYSYNYNKFSHLITYMNEI